MDFAVDDFVGVVDEQHTADRQFNFNLNPGLAIARHKRFKTDFPAFKLRSPADAIDISVRHQFYPHRLPNPSRARIPDAVRFHLPILLAARFCQILRVVLGPDGNSLWPAVVENGCNVCGERSVSAFVFDDKLTVYPDAGAVVYGAEVEENSAFCVGHLEFAIVPAVSVKIRVADAAFD